MIKLIILFFCKVSLALLLISLLHETQIKLDALNSSVKQSDNVITKSYTLTLKEAIFVEESQPPIAILFKETPTQKRLETQANIKVPFPFVEGHYYLQREEISNFLKTNAHTNAANPTHYIVAGRGIYIYYNKKSSKNLYDKVDNLHISIIKSPDNIVDEIFLPAHAESHEYDNGKSKKKSISTGSIVKYIVSKQYANKYYLKKNTPITIVYQKNGIYIQGKGKLANHVKNTVKEPKLLKIKLLYSKKILQEHIIIGNHLIFK